MLLQYAERHLLGLVAAGLVVVGGVLSYALRRRYWLWLVPVPALLAGLAWREWEFSSEAGPLVVGIAVFGYAGIGLGALTRTAARRGR